MSDLQNASGTPKFQMILASTGQDVLDKRSQLVFKAAKAAMSKKLTMLGERKDKLEYDILNLTDLSVETKDSLRPGDKNFNATEWVDKLCDLTMQLELLEVEIRVAEDVQEEYFATPTA
jgi:hypothetical protein